MNLETTRARLKQKILIALGLVGVGLLAYLWLRKPRRRWQLDPSDFESFLRPRIREVILDEFTLPDRDYQRYLNVTSDQE